MREFLHDIFNMTLKSRLYRKIMMAWTAFFSGYELVCLFTTAHYITHSIALVVQVTVFIMFYRAKTLD